MNLNDFNQLPLDQAHMELVACLGCNTWASYVSVQRPFKKLQQLIDAGETYWRTATEAERLEAFTAHPQIGDLDALRNKYSNTANAEQGQITEATEAVLLELQDKNQAYLDKFGFIFIVCATGKSAAEMLQLLKQRLPNDRTTELDNAAREQWQITLLRLNKLFAIETTEAIS